MSSLRDMPFFEKERYVFFVLKSCSNLTGIVSNLLERYEREELHSCVKYRELRTTYRKLLLNIED